jgi:uncharacterized protein (DUF488 family)
MIIELASGGEVLPMSSESNGGRGQDTARAILTVGHGTLAEDELGRLLSDAGVRVLVDVRIAPGSRRNPHFARAELERWLPAAGIGYRWDRRLGGYRTLPPDSPDIALRNESFRAYAAHMRTPEFVEAIRELCARTADRVAIMCSESVWWRCHRRLIADHLLLLDGRPPLHLMAGGRLTEHRPTSGVRVRGDALVYDDASPTVPDIRPGRRGQDDPRSRSAAAEHGR